VQDKVKTTQINFAQTEPPPIAPISGHNTAKSAIAMTLVVMAMHGADPAWSFIE